MAELQPQNGKFQKLRGNCSEISWLSLQLVRCSIYREIFVHVFSTWKDEICERNAYLMIYCSNLRCLSVFVGSKLKVSVIVQQMLLFIIHATRCMQSKHRKAHWLPKKIFKWIQVYKLFGPFQALFEIFELGLSFPNFTRRPKTLARFALKYLPLICRKVQQKAVKCSGALILLTRMQKYPGDTVAHIV